jgi:tetratricopeptide (TPR) repeat protein
MANMSALLQSLFSGPLLTCATLCSFIAAVLPLPWWQGVDLDPPLGSPAAEAQSSNVVSGTFASTLTMEQLRREIEEGLARNSTAITSTLSSLEPALAKLQAQQMEAMQTLNHTVLVAAAIFGTAGLFALVGITWILVRALGRFSELAANAGAHRRHLLPAASQPSALEMGEGGPAPGTAGVAELASARFQGAIDQLQKRILELEHGVQESLAQTARQRTEGLSANKSNGASLDSAAEVLALLRPGQAAAGAPGEASSAASHAAVLLGKGQALLNLDAPEQALACFDEVLGFDPNNAEAFVRKGLTFEKMQNWEQALVNYDRAIAADHALTIAYLYKGGVCNRLQRHKEALESYEQALQTESKVRAP